MKLVKLSRKVGKRVAVVRNLATSLILFESITTTPAKARAARMHVEKLITRAKQMQAETDAGRRVASYRILLAKTSDELAAKKLANVLAARFEKRAGGYTRVRKIGRRLGDAAEQVVLSFTDRETAPAVAAEAPSKSKVTKKPSTQEK